MLFRTAKLFILIVIWIPLYLMLCHSRSSSRSAPQIASNFASIVFGHNCRIISEADRAVPFFGLRRPPVSVILLRFDCDDKWRQRKWENSIPVISTKSARKCLNKTMNLEVFGVNYGVLSCSSNQTEPGVYGHAHNSRTPSALNREIKIAYRTNLDHVHMSSLCFALFFFLVVVPRISSPPSTTHNKVNIKIMHLLWAVITARTSNVLLFARLDFIFVDILRTQLSYFRNFFFTLGRESERGFEEKFLFIQIMLLPKSSTQFSPFPPLSLWGEMCAANFKLHCNSMWQIGFKRVFPHFSLSYLEPCEIKWDKFFLGLPFIHRLMHDTWGFHPEATPTFRKSNSTCSSSKSHICIVIEFT